MSVTRLVTPLEEGTFLCPVPTTDRLLHTAAQAGGRRRRASTRHRRVHRAAREDAAIRATPTLVPLVATSHGGTVITEASIECRRVRLVDRGPSSAATAPPCGTLTA